MTKRILSRSSILAAVDRAFGSTRPNTPLDEAQSGDGEDMEIRLRTSAQEVI